MEKGSSITAEATEFTVNSSQILVPDYIGHGTEYNQNLYASISAVDGITLENVGELEEKVKALRSQIVRIFFDSRGFDTEQYPDYMSSFHDVVKLAQHSGAVINITFWHGPYMDASGTVDPAIMRSFADVMYDLIVTRNMTYVQDITIQNEVNTTSISMTVFETIHRQLHANLNELGIRHKVKFVGGDLVYNNQHEWFEYMATNMNDILDAYSIHIYWPYWNRAYGEKRLNDVRAIIDGMSQETKKPVYITEYGVRGEKTPGTGSDPGFLTGTTTMIGDTNINAFQHAWFNMMAMNKQFVATVKWDAYKAKYDNDEQYYSAIGSGNEGYPLKPVYHVSRIFTHTAKSGFQVVGVEGSVTGKLVSALKDPVTGALTVYALNDSSDTTSITVGGLPANTPFYVTMWNHDGLGGIAGGGLVQTDDNGAIMVSLSVESLTALSTLNPFL